MRAPLRAAASARSDGVEQALAVDLASGDGNDNDVVVCRDLLHDRVVVNRTLHDIRVGSGLRAASDDGYLVAA